MIPEATLKARCMSPAVWCESDNENKTPFVALTFRIQDEAAGSSNNSTIVWRGFLSEKAQARTIESLNTCGWDGDRDESVMTNEVNLVIEHEDQQDRDGKLTGRKQARIRWINSLDRAVVKPADPARAMQLKQEAKGLLLKFRASQPTNSGTQASHQAPPAQAPSGLGKF